MKVFVWVWNPTLSGYKPIVATTQQKVIDAALNENTDITLNMKLVSYEPGDTLVRDSNGEYHHIHEVEINE